MMLVGPTGGSKTCNYRTLQKACTHLKDPKDTESSYQKVQTHILNPKSITQAQLYGAFDELTHEWTDGIGSEQIRVAVRDAESPDHHWIIFDGTFNRHFFVDVYVLLSTGTERVFARFSCYSQY